MLVQSLAKMLVKLVIKELGGNVNERTEVSDFRPF